MKVTTTAPGKAVLLGEYAVLEGSPALVMAVNRRAKVELKLSSQRFCSLRSPGWSDEARYFELLPSGINWLQDHTHTFELVEHVINHFIDIGRFPSPLRFELILDTQALCNTSTDVETQSNKLGLGSSSALTVALFAALERFGSTNSQNLGNLEMTKLIQIHREFQSGRGSGIDIAASICGGLVEYTLGAGPCAKKLVFPESLYCSFIWSGKSATTTNFLQSIDCWKNQNQRSYDAIIAELSEHARMGVSAIKLDDTKSFIEAIRQYTDTLELLGNSAKVGILSDPHQQLRKLASEAAVVYKPCGAGGGDIGVAISDDPAALTRFEARARTFKFTPLVLDMDTVGVQVH